MTRVFHSPPPVPLWASALAALVAVPASAQVANCRDNSSIRIAFDVESGILVWGRTTFGNGGRRSAAGDGKDGLVGESIQ